MEGFFFPKVPTTSYTVNIERERELFPERQTKDGAIQPYNDRHRPALTDTHLSLIHVSTSKENQNPIKTSLSFVLTNDVK